MSASNISPLQIKGLGFTGTCSLVALDHHGQPVSVSQSEDDDRNVIMWMDHRAVKEAGQINSTSHDVLQYVGGVISPEMQAPKLLWLKTVNCIDLCTHISVYIH